MVKHKAHYTSDKWNGRQEEFNDAANYFAGNCQSIFGSLNNSIFLLLADSIDSLKKIEPFDKNLQHWTKHVWDTIHRYEVNLKLESGFFNVNRLSKECRERYCEELDTTMFYDYWCAIGGKAYEHIKPFCSALTNKHKLLLEKWGVKDAKHKAPIMTALILLQMHDSIYKNMCKQVAQQLSVMKSDMEEYFGAFRMNLIQASVWKLMREAIPELKDNNPDEMEEKNIEMSKMDVLERMDTTEFYFGGLQDAAEQYEEVFRSKGQEKKLLMNLAEARAVYSEFM